MDIVLTYFNVAIKVKLGSYLKHIFEVTINYTAEYKYSRFTKQRREISALSIFSDDLNNTHLVPMPITLYFNCI